MFPQLIQCSTPTLTNTTLHLNTFRGEPAITGFDWPFTPIHNSSENFSRFTSSALHIVLAMLQPGHRQITTASGISSKTNAHLRLAFTLSARQKRLDLLNLITRRLIMQKARNHHYWLLHLVGTWFQDLFHCAHSTSFHLSLAVLVHYRSLVSIQSYGVVPVASCRTPRMLHYSGFRYIVAKF